MGEAEVEAEVEAESGFGDATGKPPWSHSLPCGGYVYPRTKPKGWLGLVAPGRHRTLPAQECRKHAWDRQAECGMGHSQQGEPQLGEGVVGIADGGDGGDGQGAGRRGQAGGAREVSMGWGRKEDMR